MRIKTICLTTLLYFLMAANLASAAWELPTIGTGRGTWDTSVGVFLWKDKADFRNLQLRGDIDLATGLRYHTIVRSNREQDTLRGFHPIFDENYLEGYGFYRDDSGVLSASLRIGKMRYLHFPYPDAISMFDQVPGIADLTGKQDTGYSGEMLTLEYAHKTGVGMHFTGINWDFGRTGGAKMIEDYIFYRKDIGKFHFETHVGGLAVRPEPLGRRENGYNVFLGTKAKGYTAGLLYEKLHNQPAYTGILVTFPMNKTTKALGSVAFDYDRNPEGFAMQLPLAKGTIGSLKRTVPKDAVLVGEITAERIKTYWQNGQARNFYEHRLSAWGDTTSKDLVVVIKEEPWYLQAEALVSPHTDFSSIDALKKWEKDRQGPAQLSQKVRYKFYNAKGE